jgi:hypothetical protein
MRMSESEPTLSAPPAPMPAAAIPPREEIDSAPIASVMMMPDSAPVLSGPVGLQPVRPRRLAFVGIAMGVGIVLVAFLVVKVVRGRKAPVAPVTTEVAKATPEPAPTEPVAVAEPLPAPQAKAAPAPEEPPLPKTKRPAHEAPALKVPAPREKVTPVAHKAPAPVVEKRQAPNRRTKAARHERAPKVRKVAMKQSPAKAAGATAASPVEHSDPRPSYERGNAALLAGDGKGAIAAYRDAVKTAPSDPIGFRGLGLAYEHEGETALAVKALRRYLKLAPDADDRAIISRRLDRLARQAKHKS